MHCRGHCVSFHKREVHFREWSIPKWKKLNWILALENFIPESGCWRLLGALFLTRRMTTAKGGTRNTKFLKSCSFLEGVCILMSICRSMLHWARCSNKLVIKMLPVCHYTISMPHRTTKILFKWLIVLDKKLCKASIEEMPRFSCPSITDRLAPNCQNFISL